MAINDMSCPNCGAPVDFAGGTATTCPFCSSHLTLTGSGVTTVSTLSELADGTLNRPGVEVERIRQLAQQGQKIEAIKLLREQTDLGLREAKAAVESLERGETPEFTPRRSVSASSTNFDRASIQEQLRRGNKIEAIKLYRQQTGAGLKEAKDAVEALERGEQPVMTSVQTGQQQRQATSRSASRVGCLVGCLPTVLFIGVCMGFIMLSSQVMFRAFGPLEQVLDILNHNETVVGVFGQPLTVGPFITGEIGSGGTSSSADFGVSLSGPKKTGDLSVSGSWQRGKWDLTIWVTYDENGEEQTIRITQQVK